ncbi:MAG: tRNA lysidine(34) synthetase TilS, partial [Rhodothermales bacterium]|nr:tRNA lysidine(34) synthetase TilS [Rhodothermales bacterium]
TVLINLARGAGPKGLGGMSVESLVPGAPDLPLIRPLLMRTRAEIESYARSHSLQWAEDASNQDTGYRRNAVRHRLLPVFHEIFGEGASRAISRSASLLRRYENTQLAPMAESLLNESKKPLQPTFLATEGFVLSEEILTGMDAVVRTRILLDALEESGLGGTREAETAASIENLLRSQVGRRVDFPGGAVWREREGLAFVAGAGDRPDSFSIQPGEEGKRYGRLTFRAQSASYYFQAETWCVALPSDAPCLVRPWSDGDRLPLQEGSTKVKDLLTEAKVPSHVRESYPVVEQDGVVVWVPYVRSAWLSNAEKEGTSFIRLSALLD